MTHILIQPSWRLPERDVTPESVYDQRRHFLKQLGLSGLGLMAGSQVFGAEETPSSTAPAGGGYPFQRNSKYDPDLDLTDPQVAGIYNNFYEFSTRKTMVHQLVGGFEIDPWSVEITGLVEKPKRFTLEEILGSMPLEERVYRFRCVEAWSMVVPWTGFPLADLLKVVQPKPEARFVRFETFNRPQQAPGMQDPSYPWPYTEGLRLDEAMNPLTLLATGVYGKSLAKQYGAPIRLVVPWKYGYKSIKSIVKIELTAEQPNTFWESIAPKEYPFESNVNPKVPHPRWSQATERVIDTGGRRRTLPFNGYGAWVGGMYPKA